MPAARVPEPSLDQPARPPLLGVVLLWASVAAVVIVLTALGLSLKSGRLDLLHQFIWDIGWIGWAPLTFVVLAIGRRYPIERERKTRTVLRLALFGVGVVLVQMAFDFGCNLALGWALRGSPFTWAHLPYIAVFKAHIYYGVYWMIVGAAHAYEFHARFLRSQLTASRLEAQLAQAELDRLKAQLQPHFLFNAHNTIIALMLKQENQLAIRMLTRLSDLLRLSLARSGQQLVTLREELETLQLYLDIQRERFRDRLTITVDAPEELLDAAVPHLLLQPLVENALRHGLENVTEDGRLRVVVAREGDTLVCTVQDNGPGFAPSDDDDAPVAGDAPDRGIGLANTRERLQQLYGARQSLTIVSPPGAGCTITLRFPWRALTPAAALVSA